MKKTKTMQRFRASPRQQGIVLVTTLLMLAVVSLLVASMMTTSASEEQMAFNAQSKNQTFQVADSALNNIINDDGSMFEAIDNGEGGSSSLAAFSTNIPRLNSESVLEYRGKGVAVGASLNNSVTYQFEAQGRGYIDDNSTFNDADDEAKTLLLQGMYRISYVKE
ncbi:pilus assembly PilX family protein [Amphritea sp. HPY]|uniref:pilus assembly PilX family protein n=1 Tax=Amphritea sp. HPY TaxID=3421652 RepID=UPI003D7E2718